MRDYTPAPESIEVPTLIVFGSQDKLIPLEDGRKLDELIPDSELVILPDTGHLPHDESPQEFLKVVKQWVGTTF